MNTYNILRRSLEDRILGEWEPGIVMVLYGPRRVGKTTLIERVITQLHGKVAYLNAELSEQRAKIDTVDFTKIRELVSDLDYLIIDEAQVIETIGQTLKVIVDAFPRVKVLASGSASFDLANKLGEPLTGRKKTYYMYPLSVHEMYGQHVFAPEQLESLLMYGNYPKVYQLPSHDAKTRYLSELVEGYLYKDLLAFEGIRNSSKIKNLLTLLALQIGQEVSLNELSKNLNMHINTVASYLDLLEKTFVIFNLRGFSRNLRKEVSKSSKYYFYDTGVRNALINNFNTLNLRTDVGALWENFCMIERIKFHEYARIRANRYFWRTYDQKEIDLIEERDGMLHAYEFKYTDAKSKKPQEFLTTYPNSDYTVITRDNIREFV